MDQAQALADEMHAGMGDPYPEDAKHDDEAEEEAGWETVIEAEEEAEIGQRKGLMGV
jgi:hypothetical protein